LHVHPGRAKHEKFHLGKGFGTEQLGGWRCSFPSGTLANETNAQGQGQGMPVFLLAILANRVNNTSRLHLSVSARQGKQLSVKGGWE
jgi:hypothetical protein